MKKVKLSSCFVIMFALFTISIYSQSTLPIVGFNDASNYTIGTYGVTGSSGLDLHWHGGIRFGDKTSRNVMEVANGKVEITSTAIVGGETLLKLSVGDAPQDYIKIANTTGSNGQFIPALHAYHVSDNRAALYMISAVELANDTGTEPIMIFDSRLSDSSVKNRPLFSWYSYGDKKMTLTSNGSLGIGTATTGTHKLAVEGSIAAREIKVQATGWADFVFKKEYNLPTLEAVEKYITEKGHLENIPSEEEVLKNGINLGEMNAKLLQKIEEMTLYMIEMKKENEKQTKEIQLLSVENKNLESISERLYQIEQKIK
ncbi:hypothetical protein [uncultured Flavobacterium sp.]|uniref:hypothetical protein n=1 Tax=uncultured Flavobacterium sp. TaxID=165435 RepID=UPI0030816FD1